MRFKEILCRIIYGKKHKISFQQEEKPLPRDFQTSIEYKDPKWHDVAKAFIKERKFTGYVECEFCGKKLLVVTDRLTTKP